MLISSEKKSEGEVVIIGKAEVEGALVGILRFWKLKDDLGEAGGEEVTLVMVGVEMAE